MCCDACKPARRVHARRAYRGHPGCTTASLHTADKTGHSSALRTSTPIPRLQPATTTVLSLRTNLSGSCAIALTQRFEGAGLEPMRPNGLRVAFAPKCCAIWARPCTSSPLCVNTSCQQGPCFWCVQSGAARFCKQHTASTISEQSTRVYTCRSDDSEAVQAGRDALRIMRRVSAAL